MVNPVLIDTCQKCQEAVAELFQEPEVAIDIEGVDLSRAGQVCLIQMCGASADKVFLFDIHQLQDEAFEEGGLKQLLEAPDILKIFYDVRADNDALFHLHGIQVQASYDVQVLWHLKFQHPEDIHLQGLKKVLATFLDETKVLTRAQIAKMDAIKDEGQKLFAPEKGGSYEVWKVRPLQAILSQYAAMDVKFLLDMKRHWTPQDADVAKKLDEEVRKISEIRLKNFVALPRHAALDRSQKKFRDFEIIPDFRAVEHIAEKVIVPSNKKGLLIGKKGATIAAIQANTGTRVSLEGNAATVVGPPENVRAALREIHRKIM